MDEFLKQKLDVKYKEEIEAWFTYLDQKEFGYNLNKRILEEVNSYMATKKTTEEIVGEMFEEPDWMKKIEEALMEKHPDIEVSKNLILSFA
jgi:predicted house-cleaning noncanonical NTP pyrophosphatase (MazG superfamily)